MSSLDGNYWDAESAARRMDELEAQLAASQLREVYLIRKLESQSNYVEPENPCEVSQQPDHEWMPMHIKVLEARLRNLDSKLTAERDMLKAQLSAANAAIAMKDEALRNIMYDQKGEANAYVYITAKQALSASPESLAAREAEKL